MEMKINERIGLYCEIYNELYQIVSKASPEHAVEIALGIFEEIAKDLRTEQIAKWRRKEKIGEELATTKQREALQRFGVKRVPEDLSKEEASEALDLLIGFSKAGDGESITRIVNELNRRWTEKKTENQQLKK
jgi:hypothetical protein